MAIRMKRWWYSSRLALLAGAVGDALFSGWMWMSRSQPKEVGR